MFYVVQRKYVYCNTLCPNSTNFTHSPRMRTDIRETFLRLFSFELIISIPRLHINNGLFPSHVFYSCILSHFFLFWVTWFFTIYEYRSGKPKLCYTVNYSHVLFLLHTVKPSVLRSQWIQNYLYLSLAVSEYVVYGGFVLILHRIPNTVTIFYTHNWHERYRTGRSKGPRRLWL